MNQKKLSNKKSSLVYDTSFKLSYLKPGYWGVWIAVAFLWVLMLLPGSFLDALANKLGDIFRNVNKKRRRIARTNIDLCFPELNEHEKKELVRRCFRHQARSILYYGIIWWAPGFILKKRIVFKGQENIESSLSNNRSVIFMAAHSLGLEAAVSAATMNYPSSGPFNPMKNKLVDWLVAKGRSRHGGILYTRDAGLRPIIKDVRGGCTMFYLPDEDLGADRSIFVPFFGVEKASVPVLGRLAKSCKADVLPCMACYDEDKHHYVIHVLPALPDFPTGDDYEDTLVMNKSLEEIIRLCPSQYFWIMKLFKTRPDGKQKLY
ncbi:MAG: hypothetical protein DIZ80_11275 [endosymbiont of Galathealinum brachiosum]|uniref:Lipid A biosynthesis acyltransferase n=1 Tax=endosymbiont of Galathealinum brachiosum TaxID=2200906 RepID=A0A370DD57_9GAMM|nr:MAG: hypothetical protein DIZ80_11275 [endosymbiont of Galathealinum brachiosum]